MLKSELNSFIDLQMLNIIRSKQSSKSNLTLAKKIDIDTSWFPSGSIISMHLFEHLLFTKELSGIITLKKENIDTALTLQYSKLK